MNIVKKLTEKGLIQPPRWLPDNIQYMTIMGSEAYGCATDTSDKDIYGFAIPPKEEIFPHLKGQIEGFGKQIQRFEQYQQHNIVDVETKKEYDFSIYSVVKYFNLLMENNPNMIDSIFTPRWCVIHSTPISEMVRENRKMFLHKGLWHKYRGYAFSQIHKMKNKNPTEGSRRHKDIAEKGFDSKFACHTIRLLLECEQAMIEGDITLDRHSDMLKEIRNGLWTEQQVYEWFNDKEKQLENVYHESKILPYGPDEPKIKELLLKCLEHHYGSLDKAIVIEGRAEALIQNMRKLLEDYGAK